MDLSLIGDIVALLAFALSLFVTIKTWNYKKSQEELVRIQKELNRLQLEKERNSITESQKANIGAKIISLGNHKYRLKVYNKGSSIAYNVDLILSDKSDIVHEYELNEKFPMEQIDSMNGVGLVAVRYNTQKAKHKLKLSWENEDGSKENKTEYVTF